MDFMTQFARQDMGDRDKLSDDLDKIETSGEFLLSLINDILDMSRIDSGKIELHPEPYSYDEFMKNLIKPGNIIKTQYRYSKKGEDKPRWYDMHSRSVRSGDDTLVLSCLLDVTADRTAELEIDRIHQMYADATKIAKLIVWTYDERTHSVEMMWSGYTREVCKRLGVPSVISGVPGSLASYVDSGSRQDFIDMVLSAFIGVGLPVIFTEYLDFKQSTGNMLLGYADGVMVRGSV